MANLPDFDPNDAYKLTSEKYINELKKKCCENSQGRERQGRNSGCMVYGRRSGQSPEAIHDNSDLVDALGSARVNILMKTWRNPGYRG